MRLSLPLLGRLRPARCSRLVSVAVPETGLRRRGPCCCYSSSSSSFGAKHQHLVMVSSIARHLSSSTTPESVVTPTTTTTTGSSHNNEKEEEEKDQSERTDDLQQETKIYKTDLANILLQSHDDMSFSKANSIVTTIFDAVAQVRTEERAFCLDDLPSPVFHTLCIQC
jgi:hypothetical protein